MNKPSQEINLFDERLQFFEAPWMADLQYAIYPCRVYFDSLFRNYVAKNSTFLETKERFLGIQWQAKFPTLLKNVS